MGFVGVELLESLDSNSAKKRSCLQELSEWRQLAALTSGGSTQDQSKKQSKKQSTGNQKRLQRETVAALQQLLLATTTRPVLEKRCRTRDSQCQTEIAGLMELCAICHTGPATHAVVPCGHCCLCEGCSR